MIDPCIIIDVVTRGEATRHQIAKALGVPADSSALGEVLRAMCVSGFLDRATLTTTGAFVFRIGEHAPRADDLRVLAANAVTPTGSAPDPAGGAPAGGGQYPHPPAGAAPAPAGSRTGAPPPGAGGAPGGTPAAVRPPAHPGAGGAPTSAQGGAPAGADSGAQGGAPPVTVPAPGRGWRHGQPVVRPPEVSREARDADTRDVEQRVRAAYAAVLADPHRTGLGDIVMIGEVRDRLPDVPREQFDAAVTKLGSHPDVSTFPVGHRELPEDYEKGVARGGTIDEAMIIQPEYTGGNGTLVGVEQQLRSCDRATALSVASGLHDANVVRLAARLEISHDGVPVDDLRERIADQAAANQAAWLDRQESAANDGTLLYRADNDPGWVAGLDDAGRQALRDAAQRQVEHYMFEGNRNGDHSQYARYVERGRRWANT